MSQPCATSSCSTLRPFLCQRFLLSTPLSLPPFPGTSFILSLRNYVDACDIKNATCVSPKWGGDDPNMLLPLRYGRFGNLTTHSSSLVSREELVRQESCKGRMTACNFISYVG